MLIFIRFKKLKERRSLAKKFLDFEGEKFEIAYEMILNQRQEWLVFLHGWGSNKEIMQQAFGKLFLDFNHLYIDLPGFGQSENHIVLDTHRYAKLIKHFLQVLRVENAIIVGHSFGGKIATLIEPKELVLLSSAGIVPPKSLKVKIKIGLAKCLKFLGISCKRLRSRDADSLSEEMYQTFKNVVDEDFSSIFSSSDCRAYIFWGRQDMATPLSSGQKITSLIKGSKFKVLEGDHYFFLYHSKEIERQILEWRRL